MLEVDCSLKESNTWSKHPASELASFDLIQESSLDWLNGAGDVQCREPQTMLLPGQQAFTNFMDQQAFMIDWAGPKSRRDCTHNLTSSMQLRWSYSLDSSSRRDMVALGNQLWLSVHPVVLLWHPSISEQEARICIAKRERSSDARNGAQECAPTIVQLTTSSTLGSKSACQLGSKVHLMQCYLVGEGEEIIMRWNSESSWMNLAWYLGLLVQ